MDLFCSFPLFFDTGLPSYETISLNVFLFVTSDIYQFYSNIRQNLDSFITCKHLTALRHLIRLLLQFMKLITVLFLTESFLGSCYSSSFTHVWVLRFLKVSHMWHPPNSMLLIMETIMVTRVSVNPSTNNLRPPTLQYVF